MRAASWFRGRWWVAIVLAWGLAACSGPISRQDLASVRRVALVVNLGEQFHLLSVGTTVFTNRLSAAPVPEWGIDRLLEERASRQLSAMTGATVEPMAWRALPATTEAESGLRRPDFDKLLDEAARLGYDTLIILDGDNNPTLARMRAGYGLYIHSFLGQGSTCIYVSMRANVYQVASRQRVAGDMAATYPCLRGSEGKYPMLANWADYSEAQRTDMRRDVEYTALIFTQSVLRRLFPGA